MALLGIHIVKAAAFTGHKRPLRLHRNIEVHSSTHPATRLGLAFVACTLDFAGLPADASLISCRPRF